MSFSRSVRFALVLRTISAYLGLVAVFALACAFVPDQAAATVSTLDPAPGAPAAFRLGYSDPAQAAADAARYRVIVLNADAASHIRTIRANNPEAIVLVYKEASFATDWDPSGISRGVGWTEAQAHPEWFLTDESGARIQSPWWPGNFLMDVASPTYQAAWARNVRAELDRGDWDGVFFDDVNWRAHFAGAAPTRYPNDPAWRAATRSFLEGTTPAVRSGGELAILNIGEGHAAPDIWADWLSLADGAMEEHFTNWSSTVGGPFVHHWGATGWQAQVDNALTAARMGKISLLRVGGVEGDAEAMRYGIATYHLVNDGKQTIAPPRFANPPSYPEMTWDLGSPAGPHHTVAPKVYRRDFSAGTVLVNATNDQTVTVELGASHLDATGAVVTRVTLAPTRGAVLRRAATSATVAPTTTTSTTAAPPPSTTAPTVAPAPTPTSTTSTAAPALTKKPNRRKSR